MTTIKYKKIINSLELAFNVLDNIPVEAPLICDHFGVDVYPDKNHCISISRTKRIHPKGLHLSTRFRKQNTWNTPDISSKKLQAQYRRNEKKVRTIAKTLDITIIEIWSGGHPGELWTSCETSKVTPPSLEKSLTAYHEAGPEYIFGSCSTDTFGEVFEKIMKKSTKDVMFHHNPENVKTIINEVLNEHRKNELHQEMLQKLFPLSDWRY